MENKDKPSFFDYCKLAKREYEKLLLVHPEMSALSARELEIFEKLLTDKTLSEIAEELYITYSAVHFHCQNIYKKLNVQNRKQIYIRYKDL